MNDLAMMHLLDKSINRLANRLERLEKSLEWNPRAGDKILSASFYTTSLANATDLLFRRESSGEIWLKDIFASFASSTTYRIEVRFNEIPTQFFLYRAISQSLDCHFIFPPGLFEIYVVNGLATTVNGNWSFTAWERYPEMEIKPDDY